jgi:hypothetical protein
MRLTEKYSNGKSSELEVGESVAARSLIQHMQLLICGRCLVRDRSAFQTLECHLAFRTFKVFLILPAALGPGVYSASNRNEYQK